MGDKLAKTRTKTKPLKTPKKQKKPPYTPSIYYITTCLSQELRSNLAGCLWLGVSHKVVVKWSHEKAWQDIGDFVDTFQGWLMWVWLVSIPHHVNLFMLLQQTYAFDFRWVRNTREIETK